MKAKNSHNREDVRKKGRNEQKLFMNRTKAQKTDDELIWIYKTDR